MVIQMGHRKLKIRNIARVACAVGLSVMMAFGATACSFGGGAQEATSYITSQTIKMEKGSKNSMCNGSLNFTVLDAQKRPVSTFSDQSKSSSTSDDSSGDIIVEIDASITFNANTYSQMLTQLGGSTSSGVPESLADIFEPGTTIYMQGHDQDGGDYISSTIVIPDENEDANTLAINAQWNYNLMDATLPEASQTREGSILFQVSSQVKDLQLVMVSGNNNADPTDAESVLAGNRDIYVFPIE